MGKPVVLVAPEEVTGPSGNVFILNHEYANAIWEAGGVPLGASDFQAVETYVEFADALVISGGPDIHPARYGGYVRDFRQMSRFNMNRDDLDFALFQAFRRAGRPVLGIGRGAHVINAALGGTLMPEIKSHPEGSYVITADSHDGIIHSFGTHEVKLARGSRLAAVLGENAVVNSFHHQAIRTPGGGLWAVARSDDNVVEAVEHENLPVWGIQWHPEHGSAGYRPDHAIFKAFLSLIQEVRP